MIKLIEIQCTLPPKFSMDWTLAEEHLLLPCPFLYFFLLQIPNAAIKKGKYRVETGNSVLDGQGPAFFSILFFYYKKTPIPSMTRCCTVFFPLLKIVTVPG